MDTKIQDAICILPRIEILGNYLEEEINCLENYLHYYPDSSYVNKIFTRMRELLWISEETAKQVFEEVNELLGC